MKSTFCRFRAPVKRFTNHVQQLTSPLFNAFQGLLIFWQLSWVGAASGPVFRALCGTWGAMALTFFTDAAWSTWSSFGGVVVRVATGTPTCAKNSSCPAGTDLKVIFRSCHVAHLLSAIGNWAPPARTRDAFRSGTASVAFSAR